MRKKLLLVIIPAILLATGCSDNVAGPESVNNYETTPEVSMVSESSVNDTENDISTYTDENLLELARELYYSACNMTEKYISGSVYAVSRSSTCDRNGEKAYLISDSMVFSMDDISREWNNVFSSKYADIYKDIFTNYFEENNSIWVIQKPYVRNSSYLDSVISEISNRSENEIEYNVVSTYKNEDGTQKTTTMPFSVIYSSDVFRVGKFIMPY